MWWMSCVVGVSVLLGVGVGVPSRAEERGRNKRTKAQKNKGTKAHLLKVGGCG